MRHSITESPLGPLTVVEHDGALVGLYMEGQRYLPPEMDAHGRPSIGERVADALPAARVQLAEYFAGERHDFELPLAPIGTEFQHRVWELLRRIPFGETASYGELARRLGKPNASRAVGSASGHNRVGIVIPCHRLVGSTGSLTGYAGGIERKTFLLALESGSQPLFTA